MIEDFDVLEATVKRHVIDALDHTSLNDTIENPTCEQIVMWIWKRLHPAVPALDQLVLWETETARAILRKSDFS